MEVDEQDDYIPENYQDRMYEVYKVWYEELGLTPSDRDSADFELWLEERQA